MLRPATPADQPFLLEMLAAASSPEGDPMPLAELEADPQLRGYVDGWGRPGDVGLVAVAGDDPDGRPLGAAWYRTFTADAPGYAFLHESIPEVAIACRPEARGQGLGHRLIDGLLDRAHAGGVPQLCLSVRTTNAAAVKVYEDCGFVAVELDGDGLHLSMAAPAHAQPAADAEVTVRDLAPGELDLAALPASEWGEVIASRGRLYRVADHPSLLAELGGRPAGLLTWRHDPGSGGVEVLGVEAWVRDRGVGAALLRAVRRRASALGVRRLWLVTNNDNVDALRFYQRRGWELVAVHRGAADASRRAKPSIPLLGANGIPVHHEIELELILHPPTT